MAVYYLPLKGDLLKKDFPAKAFGKSKRATTEFLVSLPVFINQHSELEFNFGTVCMSHLKGQIWWKYYLISMGVWSMTIHGHSIVCGSRLF